MFSYPLIYLFSHTIDYFGFLSLSVITYEVYKLAESHGDLFSRHACPLEGAVLFVAADETIVNVVNDPKIRASPRRNYNDQHPLTERPKCSTRVSVED